MSYEIALVAALFSLSAGVFAWFSVRVVSSAAISYRRNFTAQAKIKLSDLFLTIEPEKLFMLNLAAVVLFFVFIFFLTGNLIPAALIGILVGASPTVIFSWLRKRRQKAFISQLPDMLQGTSTAMRSGASLNQALESVIVESSDPIKQEFDLFLREVRVGVSFNEALDNLYKRIPLMDLNLVISGMKISREIGGNLAETLERMADTLRRKLEMEGKIDALTAQGRAQGYVMTGLPILLGLVLYQMEPEQMSLLWTEWYGWVVISIVVILEIIGFFFIRKIVNIDV
ncbi:type II secretion system F family protein [Shewanella sp. JNE10-2]|jgi:tight adherence protein B|uniref:type II secretion system F family protein n=1 Tax=unclassified Shewanella TaxID=196818 RepID=UPI0020035A03|nr:MULTISPECIES: type II secretion system F family protein [unclassified Shewanella]MCK7631215.1 type II secretion system F family protein [Shewanella sp. JNE9-1]MCK7635589.1 type II secretion system F family protein [Shewanella sp. JNE17]MCK7646468.1 type II secretion system F family protein [Shewanella sp. JNE3-1]MCK7650853.1 type II secretion system F family protein [Shewanella sp. JNE8]MCK7654423.1 type II secretion system F family protein [Shewanella sp. JNE4-1]